MNQKNVRGDELLIVIEEFVELEWRKFRSKIVKLERKTGEIYREDRSAFPPFTTIRMKEPDDKFTEKLKMAVESYEGAIGCYMFGHQRIALPGVNWVIEPIFVKKVRAEEDASGAIDLSHHVAEKYPNFAPQAYADLPGLAKHVRRAWS
jgi:hypothetical protein